MNRLNPTVLLNSRRGGKKDDDDDDDDELEFQAYTEKDCTKKSNDSGNIHSGAKRTHFCFQIIVTFLFSI